MEGKIIRGKIMGIFSVLRAAIGTMKLIEDEEDGRLMESLVVFHTGIETMNRKTD